MIYVRLASVAVLLIAVFAFHAHGATLGVLRDARIALIVLLIGGAWFIRRRRA